MCWASLSLTLLHQTLCHRPVESQLCNQTPRLLTLPGMPSPALSCNQAENELNAKLPLRYLLLSLLGVFVSHILEQGQVMDRLLLPPSQW